MKPILFLDFDRTLFDTDLFYEWLGDDGSGKIEDLLAARVPYPDFSNMLYRDTKDCLLQMREHYVPILLTLGTHVQLQELKVRESGVLPLLDEVIITQDEKGTAIQNYLHTQPESLLGMTHIFLDDSIENIASVKSVLPGIFCVQINRNNLLSEEPDKTMAPDAVVGDLSEFARLLATVRL